MINAKRLAEVAYVALMSDLRGRRGIRQELEEIDDSILAEMQKTGISKIEKAIEEELVGE